MIYQFTHSDLDGVGCAVLTNVAFPEEDNTVNVRYVSYHNIEMELNRFVEEHEEDEEHFTLLITDICPEEPVAEMLDNFNKSTDQCKLHLFDHHKTQAWVNKYPWARHDTNQCGTLLYYDWLVETNKLNHQKSLEAGQFSQLVDVYDRWLLDDPKRAASEDMNRLLYFLGFDRFVSLFSYDPKAYARDEYQNIMQQLARNQASHVKKIVDNQCVGDFVRKDRAGNKYCMLVAEKDESQICHAALDRFEEIDYAVFVNPVYNKVGMRSRKDGVDVSAIAKKCGGGGHPAASGFEVDARAVLALALGQFL
jgi:oligoribonuclease NrnB/cAMP/cGMP phosphodiesterase (DHH superfamily)